MLRKANGKTKIMRDEVDVRRYLDGMDVRYQDEALEREKLFFDLRILGRRG